MFWVPQPTMTVIPAVAGVVGFDSWGQATFQQPLQFLGVLPTFAPGVSAGMSNFSGVAQGFVGMVLGGGAALNGSNGRSRRQPKRNTRTIAPEDWQEDVIAEPFTAEPASFMAAVPATHESTQDADEMNKLLAQLEQGGEAQLAAIATIRGSVWDFALDPVGCHVVQLALDVASQRDGAELASELQGHIRGAMESKHANYVVQKILEVLPTSMASFVAEELRGSAVEAAQHRYGCRIMCRLLEHSAAEEGTADLIMELLSQAQGLSRHGYGYHVIRCMIEHGLPEHRRHIAGVLSSGVHRSAKHRHASFVVEKLFAHCDEQAREGLAHDLLQRPENVLDLARHQFGRHVVSQLVRGPGDCSQRALYSLRAVLPQVQTSKHGRRLIEELRPQLVCNPTTA